MFGFLQRKSSVEARILDAIDSGHAGTTGVKVSVQQALMVMAVFACWRVISEDVAKLPAKLKKETKTGSEIAVGEPEHRILSRLAKPRNEIDDGFTSMEWMEAIVAWAVGYGYGVSHINRVAGKARELTPLRPGTWRCENNQWSIQTAKGNWKPVERSDLMVLRGPQLGVNVTHAARQAIDLARKLDLMMSSLANKGGRPNGILSSEGLNSLEKAEKFISRITKYFGPAGKGGLMPVDLGELYYTRLSLSPEELQVDSTYSRAVTQIASAYRVQPARLMHAITEHNNASLYSSNATHVQDCIQPWTKRVRLAFDKDVLGEERVNKGYYSDIALQGLLQGAPDERGKLYIALRTVGAMSPLTVAQYEELPTEGVSDDPAFPLLTNPNPAAEKDKTDET